MKNRKKVIIAVLLMLTVLNFTRLSGNENIRAIQFVSIFTIGALSALLLREFVTLFNSKRD